MLTQKNCFMKQIIIISVIALFCNLANAQVLNGDLVINTKFSGSPYIGASGGFLTELSDGFNVGGNVGLRFFTGGGTYIQIPLMGEARYYVSGSNDGFYPFANLGFLYHYFRASNSLMTISGSGTYLSFALGAGFKAGTVDFSVRYENIQFSIFHAENFGFRVGFWLDDRGGKKKRRR